jgi:hypothetical protein
MLIYDVQSRNVYENKRNVNKLTETKSDICGNMTWILQKNSGFDEQFALIDTLTAGFDGLRGENLPPVKVEAARRPGRGRRSFAAGETRGLEFLHFSRNAGLGERGQSGQDVGIRHSRFPAGWKSEANLYDSSYRQGKRPRIPLTSPLGS